MRKPPNKAINVGAPASYRRFIEQGRARVLEKGLSWEIPHNEIGNIKSDDSWDLRTFTSNNERNATRLTSFAIDDKVRQRASQAGWPKALLPSGLVLGEAIQDFLKSLILHRVAEGILPRSIRHEFSLLRSFFSSTNKFPWQLNSEDLNRYLDLVPKNAKVSASIASLASIINSNLLSPHVPLIYRDEKEVRTFLGTMLSERKGGGKLPDVDALHELVRIVFQEKPIGHQYKIRFGIARLLTLTGLRLNEIILLPADCLQWEHHIDIVTGKPAGEVGGISRSLRLKYFGEKRRKKDSKVLVEDFQWIPARFEELVASTVSEILEATRPLRDSLKSRASIERIFKTASGELLTLSDFLFLVIHNGRSELPDVIPETVTIETAAQSSFLAFLSTDKGKGTIFTKYSTLPNKSGLFIKSHSLRHLMNTELFRQGVPDTVVTQHFGRQSVAQSYVYDHRSLAERLKDVEIPEKAAKLIVPGTPQETVAKMVLSDLFGGSAIAMAFRKIQSESGDEAAFMYLAQNSDGFHATPYGFCITSFAVNPCVRHLKCFDNCRHYLPSGMKEHRISLESLRANLRVMRDTAAAKPLTSTGRKNQVAHAERLISGIDLALAAQPNVPLFKEGVDHSAPAKDLFK